MKTYKIADLFCGAGGTSTGAIEAMKKLGYEPDLTAVNHWPIAISTHTANHPESRHLCTGIDAVNPRDLFAEGELDMLWASPECTHHSIARGGKPINDQSRATAWCVVRWAESLLPPVILVENVPEFQTWGPLIKKRHKVKVDVPSTPYRKWRREQQAKGVTDKKNLSRDQWSSSVEFTTKEVTRLAWSPDPARKGEIFKAWINTLESIGYKVDFRVLCAADFGDPTTRTRLFIQAVRGRRKIVWPEKTHSKGADLFCQKPWAPARDIIDWSIPAQSIYERKKPLSEKTMARIEAGLKKFGLKEFIVPHFGEREGQNPRTHDIDEPAPTVTSHGAGALVQPFIVAWDHTSGGANSGVGSIEEPLSTIVTKARHGVAEPFLIELRGTSKQQLANSSRSLDEPCSTVTTSGSHHALIEPFLLPQQSDGRLRPVSEPSPTVCTAGAIALVEPFLVSFYGNGQPHDISEPTPTVTCKDRFGLVKPIITIQGTKYVLDIRFRMLQPHELALAQGFPKGYHFTGTKTDQVKQIGNSVPRRLARAIVAAVVSQNSNVSHIQDDPIALGGAA